MNKITEERDQITLDILKDCFITFCEYNFADDVVVQEYIQRIRYLEDRVDDRKSQKNIKEFINKFNKGK